MQDLSFGDIKQRVADLTLPSFDLIIGIANGGVVPACLIAYKTGIDLRIVRINFRDDNNDPRYDEPVLLEGLKNLDENLNLLIVDDVSVSGKTLDLAKSIFKGNKINTLVFKGKADYVLFPEIKTCVNWPWKMKHND